MSRTFDPSDAASLDAAIDRLVTGDLNDADRHALLLQLETIPDGWRRCALSFLEDQAWRLALSVSEREAIEPASRRSVEKIGSHQSTFRSRRYALAACLLLAAAFGYQMGQLTGKRSISSSTTQADRVGVLEPLAKQASPSDEPVTADKSGTTLESNSLPGEPIGYVGLVGPADGESMPRQVPILAATAANEQWLQEQPSSIPDYVKALWERRGFRIEENRHLVGLDLDDGRHVSIPVDEVALDYVGRQPL